MNVIAPNAAHRASTPAAALGTRPLGKPKGGVARVQTAEAKSKQKYADIARSDTKFEDFAFALTGKTAKERTPEENRALAQLRKEMAAGQIDPAFVEADPANGPGDDKLPPGARGAFVPGGKGQQGRVLISGSLRGQQLQKTSDEEQGEAVSDRACQLGIGVADGDVGARVGAVANGKKVTRQSDPALFKNQASDTITVVSEGQTVQAEADAGVAQPVGVSSPTPQAGWALGGDGLYYNLATTKGQRAHMASYDANGDKQLDRNEFHAAVMSIDPGMTPEKADRLMVVYGFSYDNKTFYVPVGPARQDHPKAYAGTGTDQIYADGVIARNPASGGYATNLAEADPGTLANACLRHYAVIKWVEAGSPPGGLEAWIVQYQANGLTYRELNVAVGAVTGDTQPLDVHDSKHAKSIERNYGINVNGRQGVNQGGLTRAFRHGGLRVKGDGGHFIAISAHDDPPPPNNLPTHQGSDTITGDGTNFVSFDNTGLKIPNAVIGGDPSPIATYPAPYTQSRTELLFVKVGGKNEQVDPSKMTRTVVGGTASWTFGHRSVDALGPNDPQLWRDIPVGSKEDRYYQDYQSFGSGPQAGHWNANLRQSSQMKTTQRDTVTVWMPKEHQFATHADGKAATTYSWPVIDVNGKDATVTAVTPVRLPDGTVVYKITATTADGRSVVVTHNPKNPTEQATMTNLNERVNGGGGLPVPAAPSSAAETAAALAAMPPAEAAAIIDAMGVNDAAAILDAMPIAQAAAIVDILPHSEAVKILSKMPPGEAAEILALMPPVEAGEVLLTMPPGIAAQLVKAMPPAKAAAVQDAMAFLNTATSGRNLPNRPNLQRVDTYTDANGNVVEIWAPRSHQFTTDANGKPVVTEAKPVVSVNGQVIQPSTMYIGTSQVDGTPIVGFEYLDPKTGKVKVAYVPIEGTDSPKAKQTVTTMAKDFDASGNLLTTQSVLQTPSTPAFDGLLAFEQERAQSVLPPADPDAQKKGEAAVGGLLSDPAVQADVQAQEDALVKDGVMLDGEAMEALGYIPEGQSDPGQVYFVEKSPELQAGMTALGMGDMGTDVVHTVPLQNKGRTLNVDHEVGIRVLPLATEIQDYRLQKKVGDTTISAEARVKYASVPIAGTAIPASGSAGVEARWSTKEGGDRAALVATGQVASVVTVRAGVITPPNGRWETAVYVEGEAGVSADGTVYIGKNGNTTGVANSTMGRPYWQGGGVRVATEYVFRPDDELPPWMTYIARATGLPLATVGVGVDVNVFVSREADGSGSARVQIAPSLALYRNVRDIGSARARGLGPAVHSFLRWSFAFAGGMYARNAGRNAVGGNPQGFLAQAVGEGAGAGGVMFANALFDSVYPDSGSSGDIDGDGELEQVVVVPDHGLEDGPIDLDGDGDVDVYYTAESDIFHTAESGGIDADGDGDVDIVSQGSGAAGAAQANSDVDGDGEIEVVASGDLADVAGPVVTDQVVTPIYATSAPGRLEHVGTQYTQVFSDGSQRSVIDPNEEGAASVAASGSSGQLLDVHGNPLEPADADDPLGVGNGGPAALPDGADPLEIEDIDAANGQPIAVVDGDAEGADSTAVNPGTPRVTSGVSSDAGNSVRVEMPNPSDQSGPLALPAPGDPAAAEQGWSWQPVQKVWAFEPGKVWYTVTWGGPKSSTKPDSSRELPGG